MTIMGGAVGAGLIWGLIWGEAEAEPRTRWKRREIRPFRPAHQRVSASWQHDTMAVWRHVPTSRQYAEFEGVLRRDLGLHSDGRSEATLFRISIERTGEVTIGRPPREISMRIR